MLDFFFNFIIYCLVNHITLIKLIHSFRYYLFTLWVYHLFLNSIFILIDETNEIQITDKAFETGSWMHFSLYLWLERGLYRFNVRHQSECNGSSIKTNDRSMDELQVGKKLICCCNASAKWMRENNYFVLYVVLINKSAKCFCVINFEANRTKNSRKTNENSFFC